VSKKAKPRETKEISVLLFDFYASRSLSSPSVSSAVKAFVLWVEKHSKTRGWCREELGWEESMPKGLVPSQKTSRLAMLAGNKRQTARLP
jgi:hypothetical protein